MKTNFFFRPLALAFLLTASLSACSTGNDSGDTNVEEGSNKSSTPMMEDPQGTTSSDSVTTGMNADTAAGPTVREQYDRASEARDRNKDGLEDK